MNIRTSKNLWPHLANIHKLIMQTFSHTFTLICERKPQGGKFGILMQKMTNFSNIETRNIETIRNGNLKNS